MGYERKKEEKSVGAGSRNLFLENFPPKLFFFFFFDVNNEEISRAWPISEMEECREMNISAGKNVWSHFIIFRFNVWA